VKLARRGARIVAFAAREIAVDQRIIDLFDRYTHGGLTRRAFLDRLAAIAGGGAAATALLPLLENNYVRAETMPESDPRLSAELTDIAGSAPGLKAYLAKPTEGRKFPAVMVVHENRGLNPHIRDVARRLAVEGFAAFAIDYLSPLGGTPTDEDKARDMLQSLKIDNVVAWSRGAVATMSPAPIRPRISARSGSVGAATSSTSRLH